jgi:hypothetical protein
MALVSDTAYELAMPFADPSEHEERSVRVLGAQKFEQDIDPARHAAGKCIPRIAVYERNHCRDLE